MMCLEKPYCVNLGLNKLNVFDWFRALILQEQNGLKNSLGITTQIYI